MAKYRIYVIDSEDRIQKCCVRQCDTDEEARNEAAGVLDDFARAEVWAGILWIDTVRRAPPPPPRRPAAPELRRISLPA